MAAQLFCHACNQSCFVGDQSTTTPPPSPPRCLLCGSELVELVASAQDAAELGAFLHGSSAAPTAPPQPLLPGASPPAVVGAVPQQRTEMTLVAVGPQGTVVTRVTGGAMPLLGGGVPVQPALPTTPGATFVPNLADLIRREIALSAQQLHRPNAAGYFGVDDHALRGMMHRILMQHEPHASPTPPGVIQALPRRDTGLTDEELQASGAEPCVICHDPMGGPDATTAERKRLVLLPCSHWFHESCIVPWLEMSTTCPSCRRPLV